MNMRARVSLLTKNIIIKSETDWGCRIVLSKFEDYNFDFRTDGETWLEGVDIQGCGREQDQAPAVLIVRADDDTCICDSIIRDSSWMGIQAYDNSCVYLYENLIHNCVVSAVDMSLGEQYTECSIITNIHKGPEDYEVIGINSRDYDYFNFGVYGNLVVGVEGMGYRY